MVVSAGVFGFRKNRPKRLVNLLGLAVTGVGMRFGASSRDDSVFSLVGLACAAELSDWLEPLSNLATLEVVGSRDGFPRECDLVEEDRVNDEEGSLFSATCSELDAAIAFSTDSRRL